MALFGFGRNRKNTPASAQQAAAPGTTIQYDPGLIKKLKGDHQTLLRLYGEVATALENNEFDKVRGLLQQFKHGLQEHLLLENIRLYIYLTHHFADDDTTSEIVSDFRREMGGIGRTVMDFLRRYTESPISNDNATAFREEFEAIGKALVSRVEREENSLYTLYIASESQVRR